MRSTKKLLSTREIIKLQEQQALAELQRIQAEREQLVAQMNELSSFGERSQQGMMGRSLNSHELATLSSFNGKLETGLKELSNRLKQIDEHYALVSEAYKNITSTGLSLNRLIEKNQSIASDKRSEQEQKQLEEFIAYRSLL